MKFFWRLISDYLKPHAGSLILVLAVAVVVASTPYVFSFLGKWLVDEALQVSRTSETLGMEEQSFAGITDPLELEFSEEERVGEGMQENEAVHDQAAIDAQGEEWKIEWRLKTQGEKMRLLARFLALSMGLHVVVTALSGWSEFVKTKVTHRIVYKLRNQLQRKVIGMDMKVFSREQAGQLMTRIMDDSGAVPGNLINFSVNLVTQFLMLLLGALLLFRLNFRMTFFTLALMPFYALVCVIFLPLLARNTNRLRNRTAALNGFIVERLTKITTIKNYVQEDHESERFGSELEKNIFLSQRQYRLNLWFNTFTTLITGLGTVGVLGLGFFNIRSGRMQLGEVLAFHQVTAQLFVPISALAGLGTISQSLKIFGVRIYSILDTQADIVTAPDAAEINSVRGDVEFENVTLRYSEVAPPAVSDINLSIPSGSTVCIAGPTGCGKSTLLLLLSRLYDPDEGIIKLDGIDIRKYPIERLRKEVGHVIHSEQPFSGTIAENIAYGRPDATDEQIRYVAEAVGLSDFIESLENGYETKVGRGGKELDTEEIARLGLARSLIIEPAVLTIDDTYSAISDEVEKALRDSVRQMHLDRMMIIATSRFAVCEDADLVIVMSQGRIVQCGRHCDIVKEPGVYRRMYMREIGMSPESG